MHTILIGDTSRQFVLYIIYIRHREKRHQKSHYINVFKALRVHISTF